MAQPMSYAQALNEAKQVIVQQATRIKADAEKLKVQQQVIVEQGAANSEKEGRIKEQAIAMEAQADEIRMLSDKLEAANTAREQADALVNRQGERITSLQEIVAELEEKVEQQIAQIAELTRARDELMTKLPTQDDIDALAAMNALLAKRSGAAAPAPEARQVPIMRLAEAA